LFEFEISPEAQAADAMAAAKWGSRRRPFRRL